MKKIFSCLLFCCLSGVYAQQNSFAYPEGIYADFNDFQVKEPSSNTPITAKQGKNIVITTFRIKAENGNKIKDTFAASDGKNIYVRTNAMLKHLTNSEPDKPNVTDKDYSIAQLVNPDYLYFEVFFQSKSVKNWGVGNVYLSGIIFNVDSGTFTILESIGDLVSAGIPVSNDSEMDQRVNGNNIDLARKAIFALFQDQD